MGVALVATGPLTGESSEEMLIGLLLRPTSAFLRLLSRFAEGRSLRFRDDGVGPLLTSNDTDLGRFPRGFPFGTETRESLESIAVGQWFQRRRAR